MNKKIILISLIIAVVVGILLINNISSSKEGKFVRTGDLNIPRSGHSAFLMNDGRVLIVGGDQGNTVEIYDPKTGKFTLNGNIKEKLWDYSPILLKSDKLFIIGGQNENGNSTNNTEIYDPENGKLQIGPKMIYPRSNHSSIALKDGEILIVGGSGLKNYMGKNLDIAEIYDPKVNKFILASSTNKKYIKPNLVLLKNGNVIILNDYKKTIVEMYNPKTNKFKIIGNLKIARQKPSTTLINDNEILIIGGCNKYECPIKKAEIFNIKTNKSTLIDGMHQQDRGVYTTTLLNNGKILITGGSIGIAETTRNIASTEIYNIANQTFNPDKKMIFRRSGHTATLLKNGKVLITGGETSFTLKDTVLKSSEIYYPK